MTKEEALKIIKDGRIVAEQIRANDEETTKYNLENIEALNMAVEALEQKSDWIPVSEKPKEAGCYMTTLDHGEYGLSAGQRFYHKDIEEWSDACVIAWMPLPEPYKPQESEGEK